MNADTIALGLSAFAPESAAIEVGHVMLKRLRDLAAQRKSFAFETTLATRSHAKWLKALKEQGYEVHLIYCGYVAPKLRLRTCRSGLGEVDTMCQKRRFDADTDEVQ